MVLHVYDNCLVLKIPAQVIRTKSVPSCPKCPPGVFGKDNTCSVVDLFYYLICVS